MIWYQVSSLSLAGWQTATGGRAPGEARPHSVSLTLLPERRPQPGRRCPGSDRDCHGSRRVSGCSDNGCRAPGHRAAAAAGLRPAPGLGSPWTMTRRPGAARQRAAGAWRLGPTGGAGAPAVLRDRRPRALACRRVTVVHGVPSDSPAPDSDQIRIPRTRAGPGLGTPGRLA